MQRNVVVKLFLVTLMTLSRPVLAVSPHFWTQSNFRDYQQAKISGCSVAQDGRIMLAPELKPVYSTDQVLIWSMVTDSVGNVYLGTGHSGKVFKVDSKGQGQLFYTAKELDVFAMAVDSQNNLYVGTSPDGKVFKVTPQGAASEFFNPHSKYIWSMAFDAHENLFIGTGDQGKIFKVDPSGKGTVFFETNQTHVMALRMNGQGDLLVGSYPDGILYRISPSGKGFVLFDSQLQEVHSIALGSDGSVYISCLNEKIARRLVPLTTPQVVPVTGETAPTSGITVTVTEPVSASPDITAGQALTTPFAPSIIGQLRSAIYRIAPDLSVETLWTSREEDVFGLVVQGKEILFSTDSKGYIYDLHRDRQYSLLTQANEAVVSQMIQLGNSVQVATSNVGKLYQLGTQIPQSGTIESSVKDTQLVSKWGTISWQGETPPATLVQFYTRSGNSERPDSTWSDWSAAYTHSDGEQISSPTARFIQWKAELKGTEKASPWIDSVTVAYLPQNVRPEITTLKITAQGLGPSSREGSDQSGSSTSDAESKSGGVVLDSTPSVTVTAYPSQPSPSRNRISFNWLAEDKNQDTLEYTLYIRGVHESDWRLLKKEILGTSYALDPETMPDGRYRIKLVADDALSNPPGSALSDEMESDVFLVDNTPPHVEVTAREVDSGTATVHFRANDAESDLRRAEMSLDGGKWQMIESDDGIIDSKFEEFTVKVDHLSSGEHVIALRVYDSSGNPGLAKCVVTVSGKP